MLTVDTIPLKSAAQGTGLKTESRGFPPPDASLPYLLRLFVASVATAAPAKLAEFQPLRRRLLIFRRDVITTLTFRTLKHDIIAWHKITFRPSNPIQRDSTNLDAARLPAIRRLQR